MFHSKANISVIITTHNGSAFIDAQIESILSQTLAPAEIIVCDDASSDNTIELLQKWEQSGKLRLIRNATVLGIVENFKKGVGFAAPDNFIALCDQDDVWLPNKLATCWDKINAFEDLSLPSMVYSDLVFVDQHLQVINPSFQKEMGFNKFEHCFDTALFGCQVLGCTTLFNPALRNLFVNMPLNKSYLHDAWLALIAFGWGNCACIKEPLVLYRQHQNNFTIATHIKKKLHSKLLAHCKAFFSHSTYLTNELALANDFSTKYFDKLSPSKQFTLNSFLSLNNQSHFQKKWAFEKAFFPHWLNRFSK
jgi:glycosyltransferase involved in cell wall biosynthesis